MINYIRAEGRAVGPWPPDLSTRDAFQSEHWLMPQLEDDALLYSLHDVVGEDLEDDLSGVTFAVDHIEIAQPPQRDYILSRDPRPDNPIYRIAELERKVRAAQSDLERNRELLASDMHAAGRLNNGLTWEDSTLEVHNNSQQIEDFEKIMGPNSNTPTPNGDVDSTYFESYAGHGK